jgi:subtilisin family serine protease
MRIPLTLRATGPLACLLPALVCVGLLPAAPLTPVRRGDLPARQESSTPDSATAEPTDRTGRDAHLAALGASAWHKAGRLGKGVKVAVLDSGFRGWKEQLGKALPASVAVKSFRNDGNLEASPSQHGILCGEVVHALAPEAELLFANWEPDHPDSFLDAARWARAQGASVLSCSVIMPGWSDGLGGGQVHAELARILGDGSRAGDVLAAVSAGNIAQRHWSGPFRDAGDGQHLWVEGESGNRLSPWGNQRVAVELDWTDSSAYTLAVADLTAGTEVASAEVANPNRLLGRLPDLLGRRRGGRIVAHFLPTAGHVYRVTVRQTKGKAGSFRLVALGAGLQHHSAAGSVPFPGDGAEVLAVGAVHPDGRRMTYSSCGRPDDKTVKPDLVAPVPFSSGWRETPFSGTSAAAPQAAALAALVWSAHPDWTAGKVRSSLRSAARDLLTPGPDHETGYGLVRLPGE